MPAATSRTKSLVCIWGVGHDEVLDGTLGDPLDHILGDVLDEDLGSALDGNLGNVLDDIIDDLFDPDIVDIPKSGFDTSKNDQTSVILAESCVRLQGVSLDPDRVGIWLNELGRH